MPQLGWPNVCAACCNMSRDDISSDASENSDGPEYCYGDFRCVCWFQHFVDGHLTSIYGLPDDLYRTTEAETIETVRETYLLLTGDSKSFSGVEMMEKLDIALELIYDASDGKDRRSLINAHIFSAHNRTIIKYIALRKMGRDDSFRSRKKFKIVLDWLAKELVSRSSVRRTEYYSKRSMSDTVLFLENAIGRDLLTH